MKAGGVFCMVNPSTKTDKLGFIIKDCRPGAVVTRANLLPVAREAAAGLPSVPTLIVAGESGDLRSGELPFAEAIGSGEKPVGFPGIECDLAMLVYTSGSTGFPKGVMMTHQNVNAAATSITTYLENTEDDIILNVLPISFDYGLYQVLMAAKVGATLVLEKSFAFAQVAFNLIRAERVTGFPIVPTIAALILQMRDLRPGEFPSLRYISNTAAALPPAHIERLQELFPTTRLYSMYGLTECKRCTYLPPSELKSRPSSVGIAIPGTEAYVVDDDGAESRSQCGRGIGYSRAARDEGLLAQFRGDRQGAAARALSLGEGAPHRRSILRRFRRFPLFRRTEGRHHQDPR